jgi:ferredoxin-NADP reductase
VSGLVPIAALCALAVFTVYAAVLLAEQIVQHFRWQRFHEAEREVLQARIAQLASPIARVKSDAGEFAWSGFRKFVLKGKVLEAEDICSFYLAPHDGQALPPFLPGQYLTFQAQIPGLDRPVTRCYSLSDSPHHPDYYRITIKRIPPLPGDPENKHGLVSTHFQHNIHTEDLIDVKAPAGHFFLDVSERGPVVLIAGGIGITPLLSMLNYITATGSTRDLWFFYGVTDGSQHIQKEYLRGLAAEHENIHLHVCYSRPRPEDIEGEDFDHGERISLDLLRRLLPSSNFDYYICGPAGMMNQMTQDLKAWGVPKEHIHFEAFGAATVKSVAKAIPEVDKGAEIEVIFSRSGKTLVWNGSAPSLLEFAEAGGISIDSGCRAGNCGTCITAIRSGSVEYLSEPGAPVEDGSCLTCISIPKGKLALDA